MTKRRPVALGAAITLGFGSLFFASPALAGEEGSQTDESVAESPAAALSAEALAAISSANDFEEKTGGVVVATGYNSAGERILLADVNAKSAEVEEYAEAAAEGDVAFSQVLFTEPAIAYAPTDVVGGAGYLAESPAGGLGACSVGFTAFSPTGDPAFLSAGHCAIDGAVSVSTLSLPSAEPAVGGPGYEPSGTGALGDWGFYQHGGPGGSEGADRDPASTDIAVVDVTNADLTLLPEVTDWTTAGQDDLAASTTPVKTVADPVSGEVSKSGRTTGVTSGSTEVTLEDGAGNPVTGEILNGWIQVEGRWVHGFLSDAHGQPGDSGGAVFQGDTAVGLVSGGPADGSWMWSVRLQDALELTDGYEVALDIDAPVVESPADGATVEPGATITVSAPSNATSVVVSSADGEESLPVSGGTATFAAEDAEGDYTVTLWAANGYSVSETVDFSYTVEIPPITAPTIDDLVVDAPAGQAEAAVTVSGTGEPGATLTLVAPNGDSVVGEVSADGTWVLPETSVAIGVHAVTATQERDGETSPEAAANITVRPASPAITSVADGEEVDIEEAPTSFSGTGLNDAEVSLEVNGQVYTATQAASEGIGTFSTVANGEWTVELDAALGLGEHTVTATQEFNGVASAATTVSFSVVVASVEPGEPGEPGTPGELPATGLEMGAMPFLVGAGLLAIGAGTVFFLLRHRKAMLES